MQKPLTETFIDLTVGLFACVAACVVPVSALAQPLDGTWRTQGYGYVFDVRGDAWKAFEVTSTTCVAGYNATRSAGSAEDREATFTTTGGRSFFVRRGGSRDHHVLHFDGAASDVRIDRISKMPAMCDRPAADTPSDNFEVFVRTWGEHYISFDLKRTNWDQVVAANRSKITAETTPADLFDILSGMIQPFGDAHTSLVARSIDKVFRGFRPGAAFASKSVLEVTDRAYVKGPLQSFCEDQVQYGHIDERTGYLRILSFSGYSKSRDFASGLAALESALDLIFSDKGLEALVIDVRINGGGSDPLGLAIASRLATNEYLAYTKVARADPVDRGKWTPPDPSRVRPSTRPGFRGPVVELIGPSTVSAGETFTQALMGRSPHVTRIGESTQGVFSDVLTRRMPNGWTFGLPNEVFQTSNGTAFDGPGIPPDIPIPVFAAADVASGRDPAMARALATLESARRNTRQ